METIFSGPLGALLLAALLGTAAVLYFLRKNAPRLEPARAAPARFAGVPPEHVAAIAAALAALPGRRRIVHIEVQRGTRNWSGQARLDHHSHSIDKYRRGASW
ncbi:hypothetical protein [Niveibacterium terrae]|uniref:hypothetical protein n=1 Tax=Niveibacterium terrae TaxID=3373598 RepID=UPI003A9062ED